MSFERLVLVLIAVFILLIVAVIMVWLAPKKTRKSTFQKRWKDVYSYCAHKETWSTALSRADELLDMALKRRKYKGKNMGERLVSAQKVFSKNEAVWAAHRLTVKAQNNPKIRLKEEQVKQALLEYRQGLKDLRIL